VSQVTSNSWARIIVMGAMVCMSSGALARQGPDEYCAFEVIVKQPGGAPATAGVVVQGGGQVFGPVMTNAQGIARLCDAPPGLSEIVVGGNRCGAVSVKYLRAWWMKTRRVFVTYDNCSGEEWFVPRTCLLTIRVRDERGTPIAGVELGAPNEPPTPRDQERISEGFETRISDQFGRIFRLVVFGETLQGSLSKDGYTSGQVAAQCKAGQSFDLERTIVLRAPQAPK